MSQALDDVDDILMLDHGNLLCLGFEWVGSANGVSIGFKICPDVRSLIHPPRNALAFDFIDQQQQYTADDE